MRIIIESEADDPMQMSPVEIAGASCVLVAAFLDAETQQEEDREVVEGMMRIATLGYGELMPSVVASVLSECRRRFGDDFYNKVMHAAEVNEHGPNETLVHEVIPTPRAPGESPPPPPRRRRAGPTVQ